MSKLKLYLDMCCFNRPYDDQQQARIHVESLAKLSIQQLLTVGALEFVWSYILEFENSRNRYKLRQDTIHKFSYRCVQYVDETNEDSIIKIALPIMAQGVKEKDSLHVACAVYSACDYFITTDDRLLKYKDDRIKLLNPVQFIEETENNL
ncbi:MAG: hypothetical protein FWG87_00690 [Defluviitaleaceae bacterium]|nr:hypothetical protein [Defluviitaleaceae bacterium]